MNEDYVSFEVAKQLKEKGFKWLVNHYYNKYGNFNNTYGTWENYSDLIGELMISAPTLCIAQKWLRETKDIHIIINVCANGYYAVLWKTNGTFIKMLVDIGPNNGGVWNTYEDALNAGILETLKLI